MPLKKHIKKVLVIGSGPIVIGQAAEFDYAGTQACKSLRVEGISVVLVNSNPATIMTDTTMADRVYIEPLEVEAIEKIIAKERPDGLLPTLGGQTGLNLAVKLYEAGILDKYGVELLGTPLTAIKNAEDRELFKNFILSIGEPVPESEIVRDLESAREFAKKVGLPLVVRPAYTLGGTGGGFIESWDELDEAVSIGLNASMVGEVLLEKSVKGWKEIEYEVMRDSNGTCITVCNMENFDPMGVHTGDSIVVAPSQTLTNKEYQLLRTASLKIIDGLKIEGGCNIQFALDPNSTKYYVIEVNPRVSRSSALASKATGYPIARISAKIALGLLLEEIRNPVTGETVAAFEPALDYVVVKIPCWPFDKFPVKDRKLGTQMQATGEVMALGRTFEEALLKAVRSLEHRREGLIRPEISLLSNKEIEERLKRGDDERLFLIAEALRRNWRIDDIYELTHIDRFFLDKIKNIVEFERSLKEEDGSLLPLAKRLGMSDAYIAECKGESFSKISRERAEGKIFPVYKIVDTCAAEFAAVTPYYYSTYEQEDEVIDKDNREKVCVIGAGPIRIGQGVEFDYCTVHAVFALKEKGYTSIIINNNPETVSTDFDTADKLYFEPLRAEDVINVLRKENPRGVIVQLGGQTAINLAKKIKDAGFEILGSSADSIDIAEDRNRFDALLEKLNIPRPKGHTALILDEALAIADEIGFPLLVRPSYVLGGRAMEILYNKEEFVSFVKYVLGISPDYPILIDQYVVGREAEIDAICDGEEVFIPGIMEHIERAGVHSGDSTAVYPPFSLSPDVQRTMLEYAYRIAKALNVKGFINIQFAIDRQDKVYIIEANPRASRTVPFMSKATGIPLVHIATRIMLGETLRDCGLKEGILRDPPYYSVKVPVFSFGKLKGVDPIMGPEMKSTGEVMGIDPVFEMALLKGLISAGIKIGRTYGIILSLNERFRDEALNSIARLKACGYSFYSTSGTYEWLRSQGIESLKVSSLADIEELFRARKIDLVVNTPTKGKDSNRFGFKLRRITVEWQIPLITAIDLLDAISRAVRIYPEGIDYDVFAITDYHKLLPPIEDRIINPWR
ncbi:MAG: carbamoyl-phosphate synthase large subunit [bacterium]|nr:carbamoyl-phosphate synthase large subunit [bacterium]